MVETLKQVKFTTNTKPATEIKKDTPKTTQGASNLERTPEKDTVSVNGKEKTTGNKKPLTGWLIGVGAAVIGVGIYFLTRGKKGSKTVNDTAQEAAQAVKRNVNDAVQKIDDAVTTAVKKEEPKVNKAEVLEPDKIIIPKDIKPKNESTKSIQTSEQKLAETQKEFANDNIITLAVLDDAVRNAGKKTSNMADDLLDDAIVPIITKEEHIINKAEVLEPDKIIIPKDIKPKNESTKSIQTSEQKLAETQKEFANDNIITPAVSDDAASGAGKKTSNMADDLFDDDVAPVIKKEEPVTEIESHITDNKRIYESDVVDDYDYLNVDGIADDIFNYDPLKDNSFLLDDNLHIVDDIMDVGADFFDNFV